MNPSFVMLLVAAGIFRFLGVEAKRAFSKRLGQILRGRVPEVAIALAIRDFPEHRRAMRVRVLPFSALQIVCNALSCASFVTGLWFFPPAALSEWDLWLLRHGSLLVVAVALVVDVCALARLFTSTLARLDEPSS